MSYPEFFPFTAPQEATIDPADLTLFNHQLQYSSVQDGTINQFSKMVDPTTGFGDMPGVDLTTWSWPGTLDPTQPQHSLYNDHLQTQIVPSTVTGAVSTTFLDSSGLAFDHSNTGHEPNVQDGWIMSGNQVRPDACGTMDKIEELIAMVLNLQEKTEQRMNTIEEEIKAVKGRLADDSARLCEEVDDAISRLQTWTGQVRDAVDDALRVCSST